MFVQRALSGLLKSPCFAGISERLLIADLKQVSGYFSDSTLRQVILERVRASIEADTLLVIGHSLGSVVAYEALAGGGFPQVRSLLTLGSPLGIHHLIFDRLEPPAIRGVGRWPVALRTWVNVADRADVVALQKHLDPMFDGPIDDRLIHNGAQAHDARPYLTAEATGSAIAAALSDTL